MGFRLALSGAIAVVVVAAVLVGGEGRVDGAQARASKPPDGRLAAIARERVNRYRARHRRHRLRYSRSLTRSARRQARHMSRHGFGHLPAIRASRSFRSVGELILSHRGRHGRPRTAVRGWARSSAHRAVMLSRAYNRVGIAKVSRRGKTYWVAHVGRR